MKAFCILIASVLLVGCDTPTNYKVRPTLTRLTPLPKDSRVYVGVLPDTKFAPGLKTSLTFAHHATKFFADVKTGNAEADLKANTEAAQEARSQYLLLPTIIWAEDNQPAWSGNPDRLELQLTTIDLVQQKPIDVGTALIIGPWGTLDSYSPLEFLDAACNVYLRQLTTENYKPSGTVKRKWE